MLKYPIDQRKELYSVQVSNSGASSTFRCVAAAAAVAAVELKTTIDSFASGGAIG